MSAGDRVFKKKEEPLRVATMLNGDSIKEFKTYCLLNNAVRMPKEYFAIRSDAEKNQRRKTNWQLLEEAKQTIKALKLEIFDMHGEVQRLQRELKSLKKEEL